MTSQASFVEKVEITKDSKAISSVYNYEAEGLLRGRFCHIFSSKALKTGDKLPLSEFTEGAGALSGTVAHTVLVHQPKAETYDHDRGRQLVLG